MDRDLIIIGGGAAGLAAGCYAQMNGYRTTVLEKCATPGGLCTSWERKGYVFDGSVAGLAGTAPGSPLHRLWEELGVIGNCPLFHGENFGHVRLPDGRTITVYTDIDRLGAHLLENFPSERRVIGGFIGALRACLNLDIPFIDGRGWEAVRQRAATIASAVSNLPVLLRYGTMSISRFNSTIQDPSLKLVFDNLVHFGGHDVPILTVLLPLAYGHKRMAGIPRKGWLSFARSMEQRFTGLGGKIEYGCMVERLLVEDGRVRGVRLGNGTEMHAARVMTAADGRFSQSLLLGKRPDETEQAFNPGDMSDQPAQVNIGVAMDLSHIDGPITYMPEIPQECAGRKHTRITVHNRFYDPDSAPVGKSAVTVFLDTDYDWWRGVAEDRDRYRAEKAQCADAVIDIIDGFHPGFREGVEVVDVSTPLTRERYTGNFMGAMQARKPNPNMIKALMQGSPRYAHKSIRGFYMTGQWVEAWGGITTAVQSGRKAVQAMCRIDGRQFTATRD